MNRKGERTRVQLMDAAAALFAEHGIDGVTMAELHEETGQRNKSAVQYHFGSRDGLVLAIVRRHQGRADELRAEMLAAVDPDDLTGLVRAFVEPTLVNLHDENGRKYLRIVPALASRDGLVDRLGGVGGSLGETIDKIGAALTDIDQNVRTIRLAAALDLLIDSLAHRARRIDHDLVLWLDEPMFTENLIAMIEGLLSAPAPVGQRAPVNDGEATPA
jgi:AcrR family transcriptional regulator